MRILIQNTGSAHPIGIKEQRFAVDASTRRRGDEFVEIDWDHRFQKRMQAMGICHTDDDDIAIDKMVQEQRQGKDEGIMHRLKLYESVVMTVHVLAKGCSTTAKFQQKANFTQVLVVINETTVPLLIPFV